MPHKKKHDMIEVEIVKLSILNSNHIKLFTVGNNNCGELGFGYDIEEMKYPRHVESLADFNIVKISCGSLHVAALTRDRKVITWGCNDESPNATNENVPVFAQGLDDLVIVKVICSSNITLALSDKESRISLTINGYLYTFGCMDSYQLGRRTSIRKPNSLILTPVKISSRIRKIFAGENHSFAIDENGMIYLWGQNLNMNQISAGLHYMLALLENGEVYSFGSTEYGQLGIGVSEGNRKSPVQINLNNCKLIATRDYHSIAVNNENQVYIWGFGETYALENQRENDKLLLFKIKCEEFGEIIEVGGGNQYSVILSSYRS
ncbi:16035_t:CDS:2 [Gigaspora margarita]|uniref:16035_t:CDS:1 n=1 Tax=Gigaspora margarita TaxID=4874 RepID=A0ABN7VT22_GIGMA|nr:16035_t:CDS:2 [Gigaspora margarita]